MQEGHEVVIRWIAGTGATLSLMGSLFILVSMLLFRDFFRSMAWRLICFLSVADGIASLAYVIHLTTMDQYDMVCALEAFLMNTFELSSVLWSSAICCHLLLAVTVSNKKYVKRMEFVYHIVAWSVPLVWSAILLTMGRLGRTKNWCWIIPDDMVFGYRFFSFFPIYVALFFNVACYLVLCISLRAISKRSRWTATGRDCGAGRQVRTVVRLSMYTVVFFICWVPPLANRISEVFGYSLITLEYAQAVVNPLLGFINAIMYVVTTPRFFDRYKTLLTCKQCRRLSGGDEGRIGARSHHKWRRRSGWIAWIYRCCCCSCCCTDDDYDDATYGDTVGALYEPGHDNDFNSDGQYQDHSSSPEITPRKNIIPPPAMSSDSVNNSPGTSENEYYVDEEHFYTDSEDRLPDSYNSIHGRSLSVGNTYNTNQFNSLPNIIGGRSSYESSNGGGASVVHNILRHDAETNSTVSGNATSFEVQSPLYLRYS